MIQLISCNFCESEFESYDKAIEHCVDYHKMVKSKIYAVRERIADMERIIREHELAETIRYN